MIQFFQDVLRQKLEPLPVAALRISADIQTGLKQAGLEQIYQLWGISAISLTTRFGTDLVQRLGQIIGDVVDTSFETFLNFEAALTSYTYISPFPLTINFTGSSTSSSATA